MALVSLFAGQYFDAETSLHYNYFRYYDPQSGRYVTSDPIGLTAGTNTYGYVGGNPLYWIDPYGLSSTAMVDWGVRVGKGTGFVVRQSPVGRVWTASELIGAAIYAGTAIYILDGIDWVFNESADDEEDSCTAKDLPDQTGNSKDEFEKELENLGLKKKTRGSYDEWTAPDGSKIFVRPNGEIVRQGPKRPNPEDPHNSPGIRDRYDQNGNKIPHNPGSSTHSTGEILK